MCSYSFIYKLTFCNSGNENDNDGSNGSGKKNYRFKSISFSELFTHCTFIRAIFGFKQTHSTLYFWSPKAFFSFWQRFSPFLFRIVIFSVSVSSSHTLYFCIFTNVHGSLSQSLNGIRKINLLTLLFNIRIARQQSRNMSLVA